MSWSKDYKKSIDCNNPHGFSQRSHCDARKKRAKGEKTKSKSPFNEMHDVKTHKTVEQIAKKHRLEVSFVKKQLEMGIPIEHEHTKDKDLATDIALQHLDEIPDYYNRLKKMEGDAKKEHKKFKDVKEGTLHHWFKGSKSKDGKPGWVQADGSPCANEPGETKTPKCFSSGRLRALKKKGKKGLSLIKSAVRRKRQKDKGQQAKSNGARPTMVSTFAKGKKDPNYVKAEPGIRESMELNEASKDRPGKGSGKKDACYHKVKSRYDVWPSAYASGALVKCRKVGADNWGTKSEACWDGYEQKGMKKKGKKLVPNCVPVSEALGAMRFCPKCNKDETRNECKYGPKFWDMYSMPITLKKYTPNTPHPGNFPESYDHEHSMARSELSTIVSAAKRLRKKMKGEGNIEAWVQSKITKAADYLDAAADYVDSGEMKEQSFDITHTASDAAKRRREAKIQKLAVGGVTPGERSAASSKLSGPSLPLIKTADSYELEGDLVEYSNWRVDFGLSEDWQKVNRKDKTDGLSKKAVDAYRKENPGSKLQTAVTEKNPKGKRAKRRASFCRRMSGMKSKLTSAKTARDPDSRINKALRRWRCN